MLRRLLACLALITGLAAAGAPANAAVIDVLSEQVGASSQSCQTGNSELAECAKHVCSSPSRADSSAIFDHCSPTRVIVPTTYIGIDRAYE